VDYDEIAKLIGPLGYRDKLRLAQLLIQLARKEEKGSHLEKGNFCNTTDRPLTLFMAC
jgi:hypothetical protein